MTQDFEAGYLLGGRFLLVRNLGRGAVGNVWLAADVQLHDEPVACKILHSTFGNDRRAIADLKREVLLMRKLRHPNIVAVHSFWDIDGHRFISMEYIGGNNMATRLAERDTPFQLFEVMPWIEQLCGALDHAHKQSVLHRDVKPANILMATDGEVRLADFGIARTAREASARMAGHLTSGTLLFMSPEQLLGEPLDQRGDLYSLAATIYEWLSGAPPFYKGAIAMQIQKKLPAPIPYCHEAVNRVLLKALSKRREDRQGSCGEFYRDLLEVERAVDGMREPVIFPAEASPKLVGTHSSNRVTVSMFPSGEGDTKQLGVLLVEAGVISGPQLQQVLDDHLTTREMLGATLMRLGFATENDVAAALEQQLRLEIISLEDDNIDRKIALSLPRELAEAHKCFAVKKENGRVLLAMANPLDFTAINEVEKALDFPIDPRVALESSLNYAIARMYGG
ncbi:MAG: protein kinase [Candidatus Hydrogenedentes bacterium]|nr:protein kinase [Candidatus Hydrogenedentota bacterium]